MKILAIVANGMLLIVVIVYVILVIIGKESRKAMVEYVCRHVIAFAISMALVFSSISNIESTVIARYDPSGEVEILIGRELCREYNGLRITVYDDKDRCVCSYDIEEAELLSAD